MKKENQSKKNDLQKQKETLRLLSISKRQAIAKQRKLEVQKKLVEYLATLTQNHHRVLSFCSFRDEIDLTELNHFLIQKGKLCLPKVVDDELHCFFVENLETQCQVGAFGLLEPDRESCSEIKINQMDCILVPALAFDRRLYRLGYGKGYYDRLLCKKKNAAQVLGIGYREQLLEDDLPIESHDLQVDQLVLF